MDKTGRVYLFVLMSGILLGGCNFDVSTSADNSDGTRTAEELEGLITVQFAMQANGATANIDCPTGLSGKAGRQVTCTGTTSDGYSLEIAALDKGRGAFSWTVVKSTPVEVAKDGSG